MEKRLLAVLMCITLMLTMASCGSKKSDGEEDAKAKQESEETAKEDAAKAVSDLIAALPEQAALTDKDTVAAVAEARSAYDALSEEEKELVSEDDVAKLEAAEKKIRILEKKLAKKKAAKKEKKKADRDAAANVTKLLEAIPSSVALSNENQIASARNAYNALTESQKKLIDQASLSKLSQAEEAIKSLKDKEAAKKEKQASKKAANKESKTQEKSSSASSDKYAIASKYVGKKATALVAKIGKPKRTWKNPNCATDGEEYIYYYDGFYVGVLSQDMDSPLIVQNVDKN